MRSQHREDMRAAMSKLPIDALTLRRIAMGLALLGTVPLMSGCAETIIGAGATGAVAVSQERGLGGAVGDTQIRTAINYLWLDDDANMYHHLNLNVQEGRVMITGVVAKQEQHDKAVKLAWQAKGVKEVIDEIMVDPKGTSGTYARDSWIAAQLKTKLLFDKNIYSINYSIETVRGQIYILGVAQDRGELDLVLNNARSIEYVRKVTSYVLLKDDPRRQGMPPGTVTTGTSSTVISTGTTPSGGGAKSDYAYPAAAPVESGYGGGTGGGSYTPPSPPRGGGSIQAVPLDAPPSGT
jgi:osmotically-inducible protein OsmY